jgi:hypothetical protein
MVQTEWAHLNRHESLFTECQAMFLDGHFVVEQTTRSRNDRWFNFNGTAGVWRKSCIEDAGGWQHDTLTEDLDLSYRVQMEGYKIIYDFDNVCLSEIPSDIMSLKSQQKRWAKGSMQTAIKLLPRILKNRTLKWYEKMESILHMTHYSIAVFMLIICCITLPHIIIASSINLENYIFYKILWFTMLISAFAPCTLYIGSGFVLGKGSFSLKNFPFVIILGTGLCLNNALAVFEAFTKKKTPFVRTPKSGSTDKFKKNISYPSNAPLLLCLSELFLGIYAMITCILFYDHRSQIFAIFIFSYAIGMFIFGISALKTKAILLF